MFLLHTQTEISEATWFQTEQYARFHGENLRQQFLSSVKICSVNMSDVRISKIFIIAKIFHDP